MNILQYATEHFQQKCEQRELHPIVVPEWVNNEGSPSEIYIQPLGRLPIHVYSQVVQFVQKGTVESAVDILILRALDKTGQPVFNLSDKVVLLHEVDPEVVLRIVGEMATFDAKSQEAFTVEASKKNLAMMSH